MKKNDKVKLFMCFGGIVSSVTVSAIAIATVSAVLVIIPHWILNQTGLINKAVEILQVASVDIHLFICKIQIFLIISTYLFVKFLNWKKEKQLSTGQDE